MTRRPKDIGTAAETAVVRFLIEHGFPNAERRALRGTEDRGDIAGVIGVVWEVKGGDAAKDASDNQLRAWLAETERERAWANAELGVLVVQRRQKNVRDWWVVLQLGPLCWLVDSEPAPAVGWPMVRLTLAELVSVLRHEGYGDPEEELAA